MNSKRIVDIVSFLYIFLFVYAAISKLIEYDIFVSQIGQSPMLSDYATVFAWMVPLSELIIVAMIASQRFKQIGLYAAFGLMVMFTAYIAIILQYEHDIPCSCGGILDQMGWTEHLVFNIAFVVLGAVGVIFYDAADNHSVKSSLPPVPKKKVETA